LLIDASLEQCEAFIELLALCPKVLLGCQSVVVVEDGVLPCLISVPRHGFKTRVRLWMLVEGHYLAISPWNDSIGTINEPESKTNL
jgi:hypothetical protein